jgi:hypothetical protein
MINIKRFIDRVSMLESKQSKDFVIPMTDARMLRDELTKILLDHYQLNIKKNEEETIVQVEVKGGTFK